MSSPPGGDQGSPDPRPAAHDIDADDHRRRLQQGLDAADLRIEELWLRYFASGGDAGPVELEAYLAGLMPMSVLQLDLLAQALNERLDELAQSAHIAYGEAPVRLGPSDGPEPGASGDAAAVATVRAAAPESDRSVLLDALVDMLAESHQADPDRLPALADAAFAGLGLGVTMFLSDYDQRALVPAVAGTPAQALAPEPLAIDSSLAGWAFRHGQTLASNARDNPRLWVPILDGTERLGVAEVRLASAAGLVDDALRQGCEQLAGLIGHLISSLGERGDGVDSVRRSRPRTPAAELVWQLLPPPTAENRVFGLSGWLEPRNALGGDIFDYAMSSTRASVAMFDAMGHGLRAALMAATAVSAYRSARRNGEGLLAQVQAVDETVAAVSEDGNFVTGFIGEFDLVSGTLRYVSAGHPAPLLLRDAKLVRPLTGSGRVPFGLGALAAAHGSGDQPDHEVGQEDLQPGDWLVLHTDGVTEARDANGAFFGDTRLADFLQRAAAAGQPPAETARRLGHAVLEHQEGRLQDDATFLLTRWTPV